MARAEITTEATAELMGALKDITEVLVLLNDRVRNLEDIQDFYAHSLNNLEMIVKRLSETQTIPPYVIQKPGPYDIYPYTGITN